LRGLAMLQSLVVALFPEVRHVSVGVVHRQADDQLQDFAHDSQSIQTLQPEEGPLLGE
jgi:hypothetical protein